MLMVDFLEVQLRFLEENREILSYHEDDLQEELKELENEHKDACEEYQRDYEDELEEIRHKMEILELSEKDLVYIIFSFHYMILFLANVKE